MLCEARVFGQLESLDLRSRKITCSCSLREHQAREGNERVPCLWRARIEESRFAREGKRCGLFVEMVRAGRRQVSLGDTEPEKRVGTTGDARNRERDRPRIRGRQT